MFPKGRVLKTRFCLADTGRINDHGCYSEDMPVKVNPGPNISGPIFPLGSQDKAQPPLQPLQGTIVGVRSGRRGEESAQIVTIKLTDLNQDFRKLVHTDVLLLVQPHT
jgi:hypothetical protein